MELSTMELRTLDPKILQPNPANPRQTMAGDHADNQLIANIRALGILQPPVVRQENGDFIIIAGHRRVRAAVALDLPEILVLLRDSDDGADSVRAVSENVVRCPLSAVDQWRSIEALSSDHWNDDAIGTALALPVRTIKKLRLLAHIHPAMLDQIAKGDMPKEEQLRTIAAASAEEQASVWKQHKPRKGEPNVYWHEIARALQKRQLYAKDAKFGPDEERAFGIVWEEDLFSPAGEDTRFTTNIEGFLAAQAAWLESNLPKNGLVLPADDYGNPKLPPKAERVWGQKKKGDTIGRSIDPRSGAIREIVFRLPKPAPKHGKQTASESDDDAPVTSTKTRPDITQKGMAIIGDLRTDALAKALSENTFDDITLIGMLLLALNASNVDIKTGDYIRNKRQRLFQRITEGGHLTQDLDLLRDSARELLALVFSCRPGYNSSGLAARFAGDAIAADAHLPNMATEEFLPCLSKAALERAAASIGAVPGQRAKDTRAAIIKHTVNTTFVLPAARFVPDENELTTHQARVSSYDGDDGDPMDDDTGSPTRWLNGSTEMEDEDPARDQDFEDENRHLDADRHSSAYL
jgi:ParB/RepB/Spo0J family partition protein